VVEAFALLLDDEQGSALYDPEGNRLCSYPLPFEEWMRS
jgi:hypothetical protein